MAYRRSGWVWGSNSYRWVGAKQFQLCDSLIWTAAPAIASKCWISLAYLFRFFAKQIIKCVLTKYFWNKIWATPGIFGNRLTRREIHRGTWTLNTKKAKFGKLKKKTSNKSKTTEQLNSIWHLTMSTNREWVREGEKEWIREKKSHLPSAYFMQTIGKMQFVERHESRMRWMNHKRERDEQENMKKKKTNEWERGANFEWKCE